MILSSSAGLSSHSIPTLVKDTQISSEASSLPLLFLLYCVYCRVLLPFLKVLPDMPNVCLIWERIEHNFVKIQDLRNMSMRIRSYVSNELYILRSNWRGRWGGMLNPRLCIEWSMAISRKHCIYFNGCLQYSTAWPAFWMVSTIRTCRTDVSCSKGLTASVPLSGRGCSATSLPKSHWTSWNPEPY